jgi:hypothetical protein
MNVTAGTAALSAQDPGRPEGGIGRHLHSQRPDVVRGPVLRFLGAVRHDA